MRPRYPRSRARRYLATISLGCGEANNIWRKFRDELVPQYIIAAVKGR